MTEAARTTRKPSQMLRLELEGRALATATEGVKVVVDMSEAFRALRSTSVLKRRRVGLLRTTRVRNQWEDAAHHGSDLRPPTRTAFSAPDAPGMDRPGACRPPRGRLPHDPPRRRQIALARLSGRGRPRRRRRLSPR